MRTGGRRLTAQLLGQMRPLNLEQAMCTRLQAKKEGEYRPEPGKMADLPGRRGVLFLR